LNILRPQRSYETDAQGQIDSASDHYQEYIHFAGNRFLLPVTYLPTNLVHPGTLRVTGIMSDTARKVSLERKIGKCVKVKF